MTRETCPACGGDHRKHASSMPENVGGGILYSDDGRLALGTECECGDELDWHSYGEVLDFAMDETNKGCCRGQAKAILTNLFPEGAEGGGRESGVTNEGVSPAGNTGSSRSPGDREQLSGPPTSHAAANPAASDPVVCPCPDCGLAAGHDKATLEDLSKQDAASSAAPGASHAPAPPRPAACIWDDERIRALENDLTQKEQDRAYWQISFEAAEAKVIELKARVKELEVTLGVYRRFLDDKNEAMEAALKGELRGEARG